MFQGNPDNRNILDEEVEEDPFYQGIDDGIDEEYFKQFEWLHRESDARDAYDTDYAKMKMCKALFSLYSGGGILMDIEPDKTSDPCENKLYMYFVSLDQEKMFLYTDFKDSHESILEKVEARYEFAQLFLPRKIVYATEITDFYDVDKYVKRFMHMFGIDNTRGGSYCDIVLDDSSIQCIEREKQITCLEYYTDRP